MTSRGRLPPVALVVLAVVTAQLGWLFTRDPAARPVLGFFLALAVAAWVLVVARARRDETSGPARAAGGLAATVIVLGVALLAVVLWLLGQARF